MIKIRATLPKESFDILLRDITEYEINENKFYNLIYKNMEFEYNSELKKSIYKDETVLVQYTLTKENYCKYTESNDTSIKKAEFFRQVLVHYSLKNEYERELIIFKESVDEIQKGIDGNRKIGVKFKEREDILDPYFIASLTKENRNYLVSYSNYKEMLVSYRIKNIRSVELLEEERAIFDKKSIDELKENFDPFLSYGNRVKLKFTPEGKVHYEKVISNRPKLLEEKDGIYTFEANEYKAMLYFCGFMEMVEILEPEPLRKKFKDKAEKMLALYR